MEETCKLLNVPEGTHKLTELQHYKSCNRLIWYDLSMQRLSFTFPHQQVSPRSLPFYDEIISSRRIYLHLSDEVGVISLPNLYNLDVESFTLEDIMNHLEDGINLTKLYQAALWRFIVEHVFRDIPRLVYKDLLKRVSNCTVACSSAF